MKKSYFQLIALAFIAFATWTYMRNSVWHNDGLYPSELIMIYARDSSLFFVALRMFFVAMWGWAAYLLWTSGKAVYSWFAALFYASFLLFDNMVLATHYLQYKAAYETWEAAFPLALFRGIPEAVLTLVFNALAVWFLKSSREKRRQLEEVDFNLNLSI